MGSTILLVDDEKWVRDSSQRLLKESGYEVIPAEHGQRALDFLSKNPVDLILLDLKMPVMSGEEFLQALPPQHADVPVIVITGHGSLDIAVTCMKKGVYDFITKPFDIPQLLHSIERALEKRNLEQKAKNYHQQSVFGEAFYLLVSISSRILDESTRSQASPGGYNQVEIIEEAAWIIYLLQRTPW